MSVEKIRGIWMGAKIATDRELKPKEKMILSSIYALSLNDYNYCYASNEYLAKLYGVSIDTIKRSLRILEQSELIKKKIKNSKKGSDRFIYVDIDRHSLNKPHKDALPDDIKSFEGIWIPLEIVKDRSLSFVDKFILGFLAFKSSGSKTQCCLLYNKTIQQILNITRNQLEVSLQKLKDRKLIFVFIDKNNRNKRYLSTKKSVIKRYKRKLQKHPHLKIAPPSPENCHEKHPHLKIAPPSPEDCTPYNTCNNTCARNNTTYYSTNSQKEFGKESNTSKTKISKRDLLKKTKLNSLKKTNTLRKEKTKLPLKQTIDILQYWNSFDSLQTHRLSFDENNNPFPLYQQTKTVQNIDAIIRKLLRGKYYSTCTNIHHSLRNKKFSVEQIKKSIEQTATAFSSDYSLKPIRLSFISFVENKFCREIKGDDKKILRIKYPFLYYFLYKPKRVATRRIKAKTKYEAVVKDILRMCGINNPDNEEWNLVVKVVKRSLHIFEKNAKDKYTTLIPRLPDLLESTCENNNIDKDIDSLFLAVHNLRKELKRRLIID